MCSGYNSFKEGDTVYIKPEADIICVYIKSIEHISDVYDRYVLIDKNQNQYSLLVNAFVDKVLIFRTKEEIN